MKEAETRILGKIEEQRKQDEETKQTSIKQQQDELQKEYAQVVQEWKEAVQDGLLPSIKPEIEKRIQSGIGYKDLTDDERKDPGLKAYNEAFAMHAQLKREGKSSSFYRSVQKFYNRPAAGTRAPVFGNAVATHEDPDEYSYEDIARARKKIFKY